MVIASREPFGAAWFTGGWETVVLELELRPLSDHEARRMLQRLGTRRRSTGRRDSAVGLRMPLALRLAAGAARTDPAWLPGRPAPALRHLAPSPIDPETVRDALRSLHLPAHRHARAARPAAPTPPSTPSVRPRDERLLRSVLVRGYFETLLQPRPAARELHLSRAAYFRRLRSASERVAAWLAMASSSTA